MYVVYLKSEPSLQHFAKRQKFFVSFKIFQKDKNRKKRIFLAE